MTVGIVDHAYAYSAADLELADDLSRRFGLAASNARLYRAEQRARRAAERAVERTTRLQAITAQLAGALDTEAIGNIIVGQAIAAMRAYAGCMLMPSSDGALLELLHATATPKLRCTICARIETARDWPMTRAFRSGRPVWVHSAEDYAREFPAVAHRYPSTLAVAAVPLVMHERPSAVLALAFDEAQTFAPRGPKLLVRACPPRRTSNRARPPTPRSARRRPPQRRILGDAVARAAQSAGADAHRHSAHPRDRQTSRKASGSWPP